MSVSKAPARISRGAVWAIAGALFIAGIALLIVFVFSHWYQPVEPVVQVSGATGVILPCCSSNDEWRPSTAVLSLFEQTLLEHISSDSDLVKLKLDQQLAAYYRRYHACAENNRRRLEVMFVRDDPESDEKRRDRWRWRRCWTAVGGGNRYLYVSYDVEARQDTDLKFGGEL